jgi:ABC-type branched-subunit amino acid transport system ATPase component
MSTPALEAIAISKTYGGRALLRRVSVSLEYGNLALLVGVNGSGKTTLINCVTGFDRLYVGSVRLNGSSVDALPADGRARLGLVRTFQTPHLFTSLSVREHLALGTQAQSATIRGCFMRWRADGLSDVVEELSLGSLLQRRCESLSYGEMKLVNIARALSSGARVLLLDEPLASLHKGRRELVVAAIAQRVYTGCAVLVIEHVTADFDAMGCRRLALANGQIQKEGE